jgi:SAM-dependent MidA family methyltransferase
MDIHPENISVWLSWRVAIDRALYGEAGFYRRNLGARHFRTSAEASPRFAAALLTLLPDAESVVDIGAGSGRLLTDLHALGATRLTGVEIGPRPEGLPTEIEWTDTLPEQLTGLVIANEWLDNVPVDLVEQTTAGPRYVLVNPETGDERLGDPPTTEDIAWLGQWWPLRAVGERAEVGRTRDEAWADVIKRLDNGLAVAADYTHTRQTRFASLTGYRDGRMVPPVPDGSCDITAHVALDACAAAAQAATTILTTQRNALQALGVTGTRPPLTLARTDPQGYVRALRRAGEEGELLDRDGLGGFGWLIHSTDDCLPADLSATMLE